MRAKKSGIGKALKTALAMFSFGSVAGASAYDPVDFLATYCWECHDDLIQKGDRRLDDLEVELGSDIFLAERWEEVMHQIQLGEMPPSDEAQPSDEERREVIAWIRGATDEVRKKTRSQGARVTHRRLNREEYLNTLRSVFSLDHSRFDPTTHFAADDSEEGFRNNGAALRTSKYHLQAYFEAAEKTVDYLMRLAADAAVAEPDTFEINPHDPRSVIEWPSGEVFVAERAEDPNVLVLPQGFRNNPETFGGKAFFRQIFARGVPRSGWYELTVTARAADRHHRYGKYLDFEPWRHLYSSPEQIYDARFPMQLAVGSQWDNSGEARTMDRPDLHEVVTLPDGEWVTQSFRIYLDAGVHPYLAFPNGPAFGTMGNFVSRHLHRYTDAITKAPPTRFPSIEQRYDYVVAHRHLYEGPRIEIRSAKLKGPESTSRRHPAVEFLFGRIPADADAADISPEALRADLQRITSRLWRRPQTLTAIEPHARLLERRLASGVTYDIAFRSILKAFLCSPSFLFLEERLEPGADPMSEVDAYELASRLSYFLTQAPPDPSLALQLKAGNDRGKRLRAAGAELFDSRKADAFLAAFTEQWLGLDKLGSMRPGSREFKDYYSEDLEVVAKEETIRFVTQLFRNNAPVTALADSDFTFVDRGLARHYGLPFDPVGPDWQRVSLPANSERRGLLGQASVLTVTANGVDTSPIMRGVWALEKLFGTPPAAAPPDVPALEPDIRGAKTIRDLLSKHREVKACADCHDRIDPLGYAFEVFDPIGGLRETYENGAAIDTTGHYRGRPIQDISDVRRFLVEHPDLMTHHLAELMLTYALGRTLEFQDGDDLEKLITQWRETGLGLRNLVLLVIASEPFRQY